MKPEALEIVMKVSATPSPNFNDRKHDVDMLVLHYTGMETGDAALERMCDPASEVSAHYMIRENGDVVQLVGEDKRAWHAGVSQWQGDEDLNSRSIGIEIVNGGHDVPLEDGILPPFPKAQIASVIELSKQIIERWNIPQTRIVAHSDIAPDRKKDPGERFPWRILSEAGIGLYPPRGLSAKRPVSPIVQGDFGDNIRVIQAQFAAIGYAIDASGKFDDHTTAVVTAFQRRWTQDLVSGHFTAFTAAALDAVATLYAGTSSSSSPSASA